MSHPYETSWNPPAPFVTINFRHPSGTGPTESLRVLADSGGSMSAIPAVYCHRLGLTPLGRVKIAGFTGFTYMEQYLVELWIDTFPPIQVNDLSALSGQDGLVGRDVLNRYRVTHDGPNQRLEIA